MRPIAWLRGAILVGLLGAAGGLLAQTEAPAAAPVEPDPLGIAPAPDYALVVLYRDGEDGQGALEHATYLNDYPLGSLAARSWRKALVVPAGYDLWIELYGPTDLIARRVAPVVFEPNRVYFIREASYPVADGASYRVFAELVDEQTARRELAELTPAES